MRAAESAESWVCEFGVRAMTVCVVQCWFAALADQVMLQRCELNVLGVAHRRRASQSEQNTEAEPRPAVQSRELRQPLCLRLLQAARNENMKGFYAAT